MEENAGIPHGKVPISRRNNDLDGNSASRFCRSLIPK
jgi:hypothetical protein